MESLTDHFLIAMPAMGDPNFNETVTFVFAHDQDQAMGLVINRPTDLTTRKVFGQLALEISDPQLAEQAVLQGGPVRTRWGFVLHLEGDYKSTIKTPAGIHVSTSQDILAAMAGGEGPDPVVLALGCAGWGPGQLEQEMAANAWLSVPADPDVIFATPFEQRWSAAAGLLGVDITLLSADAGHA
jgi:putative transcriptional regulator